MYIQYFIKEKDGKNTGQLCLGPEDAANKVDEMNKEAGKDKYEVEQILMIDFTK